MSNEAHSEAIRASIEALGRFCTSDDMEEAIKAYLDASGLVLVPINVTQDQLDAAHLSGSLKPGSSAFDCYIAMINSSPNPFESKQDE